MHGLSNARWHILLMLCLTPSTSGQQSMFVDVVCWVLNLKVQIAFECMAFLLGWELKLSVLYMCTVLRHLQHIMSLHVVHWHVPHDHRPLYSLLNACRANKRQVNDDIVLLLVLQDVPPLVLGNVSTYLDDLNGAST